jgi:hypothetical protein
MQTARSFIPADEFSAAAIFFRERNKPLHVFLNGANLGSSLRRFLLRVRRKPNRK